MRKPFVVEAKQWLGDLDDIKSMGADVEVNEKGELQVYSPSRNVYRVAQYGEWVLKDNGLFLPITDAKFRENYIPWESFYH